MRLLETSNIRLVEFTPNVIPPYAILSHRWGLNEVLFADLASQEAVDEASRTKAESYEKICLGCRQARFDNLAFLWIDTCCIDKSSSAELSEALNSMYIWYQNAEQCYAYLSDVITKVSGSESLPLLTQSQWFKRGWTLQELIAPSNVTFFSKSWVKLGNRNDDNFKETLSLLTGIDVKFLDHSSPIEIASLAKRMSWAADRRTTRPEDIAYCLMGIFFVNMPMLYGEGGEKAFLRLQEEIMKTSDDHSLFGWIEPNASSGSRHGLLATSPKSFASSQSIISYSNWVPSPSYSMTNKGLRMDLNIRSIGSGRYSAALNCAPPGEDYSAFLAVHLEKISDNDHQYVRVDANRFHQTNQPGDIQTVCVRQSIRFWERGDFFPDHVFLLRNGPSQKQYPVLRTVVVPYKQPIEKEIREQSNGFLYSSGRVQKAKPAPIPFVARNGTNKLAGAIFFDCGNGKKLLVMLGSIIGHKVGFDVKMIQKGELVEEENLKEMQELFSPKSPAEKVVLADHAVSVQIETKIRMMATCCVVNIVDVAIHRAENSRVSHR